MWYSIGSVLFAYCALVVCVFPLAEHAFRREWLWCALFFGIAAILSGVSVYLGVRS